MIETWLEQAEFWHWWAFGLVFLILEVFIPGFIILWFGVGAFVVGIILLAVDLGPQMQLVIWSFLSIFALLGWRQWRKGQPMHTDDTMLNRRGEAYVGRTFTLDTPTENGFGKIKVDDTTWKIEISQDLLAGTKIVITGVDGAILKAEKAELPS